MARKSKRKQTVIAFEKSISPINIDINKFELLILNHNKKENVLNLLELIYSLNEAETQTKQCKILQINKQLFREILLSSYSNELYEENTLKLKIILHILLNPSHIWLRKYLEWLPEAITKSNLLPSADISACVREVCLDLLDTCINQENLCTCLIDRCFEWVYTFQWMYQLDKEFSWLDDAVWVSDQGCWNSSVWPAGQDLGEGTLLKFISAMEPLLRRCANVLSEQPDTQSIITESESYTLEIENIDGNDENKENNNEQDDNGDNGDNSNDNNNEGRGATEVMRFAECVGECMRVLSAVLKTRRGALIPAYNEDNATENDKWGTITDSILYNGCKILSSDLVSKDVLISTALAVINIQWLLRVRLWEKAETLYHRRQRTQSEINSTIENNENESNSTTWKYSTVCPGLQLIAILGLLQLNRISKNSDNNNIEGSNKSSINILIYPYSLLVGVSPIFVTALTPSNDHFIPYLSRCAILRACISVFDLSALMFQPNKLNDRNIQDVLAYVVTFNEDKQQSRVGYSNFFQINPLQLEHVSSLIISELISTSGNNNDVSEYSWSSGLFFGVIYDLTSLLCLESATPTSRLFGLQTMETWLGRIEIENLCARVGTDDIITGRDGQPVSIGSQILRNCLIFRLASISSLLTKAWSHPAKLVNHMVPVVYQRVVELNHILDTMMQSRNIVGAPDHPDIWEPFIANALSQPVEHRGRYQALSALLPKVGGQRLLQIHPEIFRSLVLSMRVRDVGSSVGSFFGNLLRSLISNALLTSSSIRKMYFNEVATALISSEYKLRINTADYIIPEILTTDIEAGPLLIEKIRKIADINSTPFAQKLWGIISVVLHARLLGKSGGKVSHSHDYELTDLETPQSHKHHWRPLTIEELESVCLSEDIDLRLAGLAVLTASQRTVNPMAIDELNILKSTLPYSLKSPLADIRQRVLRVLRILVTRLKESYRSSIRDLKKLVLYRYKDEKNKDSIINNCNQDNGINLARFIIRQNEAPDTEKNYAQIALDVVDTIEWLNGIIMANIYPGAPNDREMMALEMLKCIFNGITGILSNGLGEKVKNSHVNTQDDSLLESALLSVFFTKQLTQSLLNLLISSWDKTRMLAAELLLLLPKPLPGYDTSTTVTSLWNWGCKLVGSAKQRESDSGALILRVLMVIYSLQLKWKIVDLKSNIDNNDLKIEDINIDQVTRYQLIPPTNDNTSPQTETNHYINVLCDLLDNRLGDLSTVFNALSNYAGPTEGEGNSLNVIPPMPSMLSHGLTLTLRYCIEDLNTSGILNSNSNNNNNNQSKDKKHNKSQQKSKDKKNSNKTIEGSSLVNVDWSTTIKRVMNLALHGLETSLQIVAETPVDNFFAPVPKKGAGKDHLLQDTNDENYINSNDGNQQKKKSGNTHGYASDSFMLNTNIFMELDDNENDNVNEGKEDSIGRRMQYAVVGAWLLVKESCALLAKLVEISPPPPLTDNSSLNDSGVTKSTSNETYLLTTDEISHIGAVILDALSRLKHNGAIAEAQASLQSVCESVLKYSGRSDVALCRLPLVWINNLIDKLNGEQQVFILRRSAGFAFSFLSLLRSEPKNCKPILLPLAMNVLFEYAMKGIGNVDDDKNQQPAINVLEGTAWRTVVHSLNIMRLIILDATLGPDLHPYMSQATKIAVRGFQSPLWAIRNSSMMVFSAIVQRTIDNDKKESGGRRAATPREFFLRHPPLFPFILHELANIVNAKLEMNEKGYPVNILWNIKDIPKESSPSLYPILLMLSKMRTDSLESVPSEIKISRNTQNSDLNEESNDSNQILGEENCDIDLFIPLVQLCANQRLYQVRVMAAKALSSLVPLQKVPTELVTIIDQIISSLKVTEDKINHDNQVKRFSSNLLHGMLLQIYDLITNLKWFVCGESADMGNNKIFYSNLVQELSNIVVPKIVKLQQSLISAAVKDEKQKLFENSTFSPNQYFPYAPAILLTLKRIVSALHNLCPSNVTIELLIKICEMNTSILFDSTYEDVLSHSELGGNISISASHIPFAPLLWKESLIDLVSKSFKYELMKQYPELSSLYYSKEYIEKLKLLPLHQYSLKFLLTLIDHPVSEVREGFIQGFMEIFNDISQLDTSSSENLPTNKILILSLLSLAGLSETGQYQSFITILFRRIVIETEPPVLQITLQLLLTISLWIPFTSLDDDTKEDCLNTFGSLIQISCGTYQPDTILDFLDPTIDKSTKFSKFDEVLIDETNDITLPTFAPTISASYSLQVLGWMVRSFFESSIMSWNVSTSEGAKSQHSFGYLLPELDCELKGINTRDSIEGDDDDNDNNENENENENNNNNNYDIGNVSEITCQSGHIWSWLRLLELAGVGEGSGVDSRLAAAKSLLTSKALFWSTRSSVDGIRQLLSKKTLCKYSGGGAFACRIWMLALKMLQDDDTDVRNITANAVGTATKLALVLTPELDSWFHYKLTMLPSLNTPLYDDFDIGTVESLMKVFVEDSTVGESKLSLQSSNSSDKKYNISGVNWTQGLIIEQMKLPMSLSIIWSHLQTQQKGNLSDWISESLEFKDLRNYLKKRIDLFNPSEYNLIIAWIDTFYEDDVDTMIPTQYWSSTLSSQLVESGANMEVPDKIFEADQSNLFEESTIFASVLSYSLTSVTAIFPCKLTLSISTTICKIGILTLNILQEYLNQQLSNNDGNSLERNVLKDQIWIGGITYHPVYYIKFYNSLIGSVYLLQQFRQSKKLDLQFENELNISTNETDAIHALFPLLLTLRTKARNLLSQMNSKHFIDEQDKLKQVNGIIHPILISLIIEISGSDLVEIAEPDQPLCLIL